jgi:dipeptidyl aminopeptidase/acylaminoacyl peptidase
MVWQAYLRLGLCVFALALARPAAPSLQNVAPAPAGESRDSLTAALALPVASGLVGARDVPRFAWVENQAGVRNIWFADRGQPARRITRYSEDDGQQIYGLELSRDGTKLAFVRGGDEEAADDDWPNPTWAAAPPKQQLFLVSLDGGTPQLVGEGHSPAFAPDGDRLAFTRRGDIWVREGASSSRKLASVRGEVERLQWSPDGKRLLFVEDRGQYGFVAVLDVGEERLNYVDPGLGWSVEPTFSPDGRQLAFIRFLDAPASAARESGPYWSIRVVDIDTGKARAVWTAPPGPGSRYYESRGRDLFWSADGKLLFPWERAGWTHVYAVDAASGGEAIPLTPGQFEVETFLLGPDGRTLIYSANTDDLDRKHIWRRPLGRGEPVRVTGGAGIESFPTLGGDAVAVIATDASSPAYPALAGRRLEPLTKPAAARGFVTPEPVVFRTEDGVEVHGQWFRGRGSGKRPGLVYIHGGPRRQMFPGFHPSGYYSNAYVMNQHLASKGYDVLAVNYRGGTGYGRAFREAPGTGREGAAEYRDVLAAGRWLAARAEVDPQRIGVIGGSWGGYLAALGLARNSEVFAAGVDFHGVHSLLRPLPDSLSPDAQAAARQLQWQSSPLASIDRWRSPVLLIHGDDDRNVNFSQSLLLARELAARGIPYREFVMPNERHTFLLHANWLESFRAADVFLDEHLMRKAGRR